MKARIGVIASPFFEPRFHLKQNTVGHDYVHSVEVAGGIPIIIPYLDEDTLLDEYVELCDGFLFCGGADINPILYNEEPDQNLGGTDIAYDYFQLHIIQKVLKQNKPLLGICRGLQLLNIALGGTLYQDLPHQVPSSFRHFQVEQFRYGISHKVFIQQGTILHSLLGDETYTNSFHHQAVKDLGHGLRVAATASDETIEAIEVMNHPCQIAVQWHPENFIQISKDMVPIFKKLVDVSTYR